MRRVLSIVAGLIVGMIAITLIQLGSSLLYPPPADLDFNDREALGAWIESLPAAALIVVLISHSLGALLGAFTCAAILRRPWWLGTVIIGTFFLIGGISNLLYLPHPTWFTVVDLLLYLPAAFLGATVAGKVFGAARNQGPNSE